MYGKVELQKKKKKVLSFQSKDHHEKHFIRMSRLPLLCLHRLTLKS